MLSLIMIVVYVDVLTEIGLEPTLWSPTGKISQRPVTASRIWALVLLGSWIRLESSKR